MRIARNGLPIAASDAAFSWGSGIVTSGEGWFETMRGEAGRWMFAEAHLDRLARGVEVAGLDGSAARAAAAGTLAALSANAVETERVRLVVTPELSARSGWSAVAVAAHYNAPTREYERGVTLVSAGFPHPGLGQFGKSVSYHWSAVAQRQAVAAGADEAVFWRDGAVAEAARAAVIWQERGRWFTPDRPDLLASVTLAQFEACGISVERARLDTARLEAVDGLALVSSLRLVVPVVAVDGRIVPNCAVESARLRTALLRLHASAA